MAHIEHHVAKLKPDNFKPGKIPEVDKSQIPPSNMEAEYLPNLYRETWPKSQDAETTYRMPNLYLQQRFESVVPGARHLERIENHTLPWNQGYDSSFHGDTIKHAHQPESAPLPLPVVESWTGLDTTDIERMSSAMRSAPAYLGSQHPKLELDLVASRVQRADDTSRTASTEQSGEE